MSTGGGIKSAALLRSWLGDDISQVHGIGRYIDHTLLKPEATYEQVVQLCQEAKAFWVKAVCVNGCWVRTCAERLRDSEVKVAAVVGFPLGAMSRDAKASETRLAVDGGAGEIDIVMSIGHARAGDWAYVQNDIRGVVEAAGPALVKVILETGVLDTEQVTAACRVAQEAGASFVKTSTGFHPSGGATAEVVALMRRVVGLEMGVKASGGIRTPEAALSMLAAGANRLGMSNTAALGGYLGPSAPRLSELLASGHDR